MSADPRDYAQPDHVFGSEGACSKCLAYVDSSRAKEPCRPIVFDPPSVDARGGFRLHAPWRERTSDPLTVALMARGATDGEAADAFAARAEELHAGLVALLERWRGGKAVST